MVAANHCHAKRNASASSLAEHTDTQRPRIKIIGISPDTARKLSRHLFFLGLYYDGDNLTDDAQEAAAIKQQLCAQLSAAGEPFFDEFDTGNEVGGICSRFVSALPQARQSR